METATDVAILSGGNSAGRFPALRTSAPRYTSLPSLIHDLGVKLLERGFARDS